MSQNIYKSIIGLLLVMIIVLGFVIRGFEKDVDCSNPDTFGTQRVQISKGFQTSAKYISKLAKLDACEASDKLKKSGPPDLSLETQKARAQQIQALIKDLEIKATSYAFINKVFFWASLALAICIMVIPIVHSATDKNSIAHKIFSPTQLPAIVVLAGLCFTFYSDYKGKQTSAENLMRYAYFSTSVPIEKISETVRKGLAEIDSGHDFSSLLK